MTRENLFQDTAREDWMTEELEEKIKSMADKGKISCAKAQKFARENSIAMNKMRAFLDVVKLKVHSCQLGCF